MAAPNKLIGEVIQLANFQKPGKAGVITNGYGSILEANAEAAELFNVSSAGAMRNVLIVSYAHRASVTSFRKIVSKFQIDSHVESKEIVLRPRGKQPFRAFISGRVVARNHRIAVIYWELSNAEVQINPSGEYNFSIASGH